MSDNVEFSWHMELFDDKFNLLPQVRNQGEKHTCVFQALSAASEMEHAKKSALRGKESNKKILTDSFIGDYERIQGTIPNDKTWRRRLQTALEMFKTDGVLSQDGGKIEKSKILGYQLRDHLNFEEVAALISEGRPIIGSFKIDEFFARLLPGQIYKYDEANSKKTDGGHHCSHAVVFVGYGWEADGLTYLVFLNSHGTDWCEAGIGRVYFSDVRNLTTVDI